jgi:hypothetical protein
MKRKQSAKKKGKKNKWKEDTKKKGKKWEKKIKERKREKGLNVHVGSRTWPRRATLKAWQSRPVHRKTNRKRENEIGDNVISTATSVLHRWHTSVPFDHPIKAIQASPNWAFFAPGIVPRATTRRSFVL